MPSYLCENCGERMTLKKASGNHDRKKCPTCGKVKMVKEKGSGIIDESMFGF